MDFIDLMPNAMSFRVVTTIDVDDEADIPAGFTGRVRRHEHSPIDHVAYVAWYADGHLHDPARGHPAFRRLRSDGRLKYELFYRRGLLQDPSASAPAVRGYFADGTLHYEERYRAGVRHDGADGSAAIRKFRADGSLRHELHYSEGRRCDAPATLPQRGRPA